ncbi:MAG TPA: hypothetical protein VK563_07775 [Puia sp.]|nr:hypothetical protein [Puia sp.]
MRNIPFASSVQKSLSFDSSFEVGYFFGGQGNFIVAKPILINAVVIFLVHFPEGEEEPMAIVYNEKDAWSDIEKESTGLTEAIGAAIETYYSTRYLPWSGHHKGGQYDSFPDSQLSN